jgi:hypothetical protein
MRIYRAHFIWNGNESTTYGYYSSRAAANKAVAHHVSHPSDEYDDAENHGEVEVIEVEISKAGLLGALNEYANEDTDNA